VIVLVALVPCGTERVAGLAAILNANGIELKVAVMTLSSFILIVQSPVPVHSGALQPVKVEFKEAVAVKVTDRSDKYNSVQSVPQWIPAGEETMIPSPDPLGISVRRNRVSIGVGGVVGVVSAF